MKNCLLCENEKCPNWGMDDWSPVCYDDEDEEQCRDEEDEEWEEIIDEDWEDAP